MRENVHIIHFWPGNALSYTTTRLSIYCGDRLLSAATGFIMQYAQKFWLLTSLHVITGINPTNRFVLSTTGCVPTRITFFVLISESNTDRKRRRSSILVREVTIDLFDTDGKEVWFGLTIMMPQTKMIIAPSR